MSSAGELEELAGGSGAPRGRRLFGCCLQLGGDVGIRPFRSKSEVAGALLEIADRGGEGSMHGAALPDRRLLVADRGEQRVREPNVRPVELDHTLSYRRLQRLEHPCLVSVRPGHDFDRRTGERCNLKQDVAGVGRKSAQTLAEQLLQALGDAQCLAAEWAACWYGRVRGRARARRTRCPRSLPRHGRAPGG